MTKSIAWNTGNGNITLTYQGQGDGAISVISDPNDGGARSQVITIQTTKGGLITKNVTVSKVACPIPVGTVLNYNYTGNYQEVTLPASQYKLQCWGAQGGSNAAASSYGITAQSGGKGGYSEGIIIPSSPNTFLVYVGGQNYQDIMNEECHKQLIDTLEGDYDVTIKHNGEYMFIIIPISHKDEFRRADMSGLGLQVEIPLEATEMPDYVVYKSLNTYRAGTYNIDIDINS